MPFLVRAAAGLPLQPGMDSYSRGIRSILAPDATRLDFRHELLSVDEHRHLTVIVYFRDGPSTGAGATN